MEDIQFDKRNHARTTDIGRWTFLDDERDLEQLRLPMLVGALTRGHVLSHVHATLLHRKLQAYLEDKDESAKRDLGVRIYKNDIHDPIPFHVYDQKNKKRAAPYAAVELQPPKRRRVDKDAASEARAAIDALIEEEFRSAAAEKEAVNQEIATLKNEKSEIEQKANSLALDLAAERAQTDKVQKELDKERAEHQITRSQKDEVTNKYGDIKEMAMRLVHLEGSVRQYLLEVWRKYRS
ncbi:hypothetical protein BDV96DRAFT_649009 [Lophiotrema nucula]|uniref:Uncharacterized protein n=1 Tax=Lophiotrema nucula TaxID=690887 RepID=A0A6A5Z136_9PLEO|nr:hypothetical protein BDV96DRAFT_649009 [Lophiotrema nucula]